MAAYRFLAQSAFHKESPIVVSSLLLSVQEKKGPCLNLLYESNLKMGKSFKDVSTLIPVSYLNSTVIKN